MSIVRKVWFYGVESPLNAVGLLERPQLRFATFALATYAALQFAKPRGLFTEEGEARNSKLLHPEDEDAVIMNDKSVALFVGLMSVVFI